MIVRRAGARGFCRTLGCAAASAFALSYACTRAAPPAIAVAACAMPAGDSAPHLFLEAPPAAQGDSVASVRLCLAPGSAQIGSYHATIEYDTMLVSLAQALAAPNGLQAVNPNVGGVVVIAGAAPSGFRAGPLATLHLRPRTSRMIGSLKLTLVELNATGGADLRAAAAVAGFPSADKTLGVIGAAKPVVSAHAAADSATQTPPAVARTPSKKTLTWIAPNPHIDSLTPSGASLAGDALVEVVIHGAGFTPDGNTVTFGATPLNPLPSDKGTTIRFLVPTTFPSTGEVPPMRIGTGDFAVRVRNGSGVSNTVTFTVR